MVLGLRGLGAKSWNGTRLPIQAVVMLYLRPNVGIARAVEQLLPTILSVRWAKSEAKQVIEAWRGEYDLR